MPETMPDTLTLRYRVGYVLLMLGSGLIMGIGGPLLAIASIVLFRPPGVLLGIFMAATGFRWVRRYGKAFVRRQATFLLDWRGIRYSGSDGYFIPWTHVLGLYAVRSRDRVTDLYFYISENPVSALFAGDTDPRSAIWGGHSPESPNRLHLRLRHFDIGRGVDVEARFRAFAPRKGAFPDGSRVLNGRVAPLNLMVLAAALMIVFGGIFGSMADSWTTGLLVFAGFQCVSLLAWAAGRLRRMRPGWATPCLIAVGNTLYVPGSALGSVKFADILNVVFKWNGLIFMFKREQISIYDPQYNTLGLVATYSIRTVGNAKEDVGAFFAHRPFWNNGKKIDIKKIRQQKKQDEAELKKRLAQHRRER